MKISSSLLTTGMHKETHAVLSRGDVLACVDADFDDSEDDAWLEDNGLLTLADVSVRVQWWSRQVEGRLCACFAQADAPFACRTQMRRTRCSQLLHRGQLNYVYACLCRCGSIRLTPVGCAGSIP